MKFKILKSGEFKFKPTKVRHWDSMSTIKHYKYDIYDCKNLLVLTRLQIFWLFFIIDIKVDMELQSVDKIQMVNKK